MLFKRVGDAVQAAFPTALMPLPQPSMPNGHWQRVAGPRWVAHSPSAWRCTLPPLSRVTRTTSLLDSIALPAWCPLPTVVQVLLTLVTQNLASDALPPGASLRDLGEHPLRDLNRPEHVFQLLHPDLTTDFPPIRTLTTRLNNLPVEPTPFLGREDQVAGIVDLLRREDVRLLTITGPGAWARPAWPSRPPPDLLADFPDGIWFVDLSVLDDPTLVPSAIARVLGVREEGSGLTERLSRVLGGKRLLLVLDNFERVLESASLVTSLLAGGPGAKVLVTSRTPLHTSGEQEYPLSPLLLPDPEHLPTLEHVLQFEAVRLFVERAQAVKPGFR